MSSRNKRPLEAMQEEEEEVVASVPSDAKWVCVLCFEGDFTSQAHLQGHLALVHHLSRERESTYDAHFPVRQPSDTRLHLELAKIRPSALKYHVHFCCEYFLTEATLKEHLKAVHSVEEFTCPLPYCGRSFTQWRLLREHLILLHGSVNSWPCCHCSIRFTTRQALHAHGILHHQEGVYRCLACKFLAKYRIDVIEHFNQMHTRKSK